MCVYIEKKMTLKNMGIMGKKFCWSGTLVEVIGSEVT